jgi:primary-amine oxidase
MVPKFIAGNRAIENEDIVLWHTFGHTHVCKPEDMPVMACEYAGFMLKPNGFFSANPAMDLPPDKNAASKRASEPAAGGGGCCD